MARTLIRNATVITVDPKLGDLHRGDILIDGAKIAAVGRNLKADGAEVIDANGMIAIPGFVDTHRHTWQSLLRRRPRTGRSASTSPASASSWAVSTRRTTCTSPTFSARYEALDAGITTLYDWSHNNNSPEHADGPFGACVTPASAPSSATATPTTSGSRRASSPPTSPTSSGCGAPTSPPTTPSSPWPSRPRAAIHHPRHHRGRLPPPRDTRSPDHHPCRRRPVGHVEAARPAGRAAGSSATT